MGAMVTVRNDGPDAVECICGPLSKLMQAGDEFRVNVAGRIMFKPVEQLSQAEMDLHLGIRREPPREMGRSAEDD